MSTPPRPATDLIVAQLLWPARLVSGGEALGGDGSVPRKAGIYAWYFDVVPPSIDAGGCHRFDGWTLLYAGIAPAKPPGNGRAASKSHLHQRLRHHFHGNAAGSTLRFTLGCLLEPVIETVLRRVGPRELLTFTNPGERRLDGWVQEHARIAWVECDAPWTVEEKLLKSGLSLPLNIDGNPCAPSTGSLSALRAAARNRARMLPVILDRGGPRRDE